MVAMHLDSDGDAEKNFHEEAFFSIFGDRRALKWTSPDDPPSTETHITRAEQEAKGAVKDYVNDYLNKTIGTKEGT